jgi:CRP-like cAMP-binding protein
MSGVSKAETIRMLGEVPLFAGLTKGQMGAVAKLVDHESFEPGAVLVTEGRDGVRLLMVRSGTAAVTRGRPVSEDGPNGGVEPGTSRRLATVGPGDLVGELSLIDGWPTSASVVAETPLEALVLYRTRFNRLLRSMPQLYPRLLRAMAARIRAVDRHEGIVA